MIILSLNYLLAILCQEIQRTKSLHLLVSSVKLENSSIISIIRLFQNLFHHEPPRNQIHSRLLLFQSGQLLRLKPPYRI